MLCHYLREAVHYIGAGISTISTMTITTWVVTRHGDLAQISKTVIGDTVVDVACISTMDMGIKVGCGMALAAITRCHGAEYITRTVQRGIQRTG
jgi:hypothetical protein